METAVIERGGVAPSSAREYKARWARVKARQFVRDHGYSLAAHQATGGLRGAVLDRDGYACVRCGMTDAEHKAKWGSRRPITVDHKDKNRKNNTLDNLQTLCLSCHGRKDLLPSLRQQQVPAKKAEILRLRASGSTYQSIADEVGFSIGTVWKWIQLWEKETS